MLIQVDMISRELVKPSAPTPHHLRHLDFSFIDQLMPQVSMSFVHFFSNESAISNSQNCNLLKKSLSEVLTIFYPLAGRVRNDTYIDCNDEGFLFVEARASCKLSEVLRERNPINNNYFTPFQPNEAGDLTGFSQITFFACGGLAISFGMCHKVGDASSMFTFLNSWAARARGDIKSIATQSFGHAMTFPPINIPKFDYSPMISKEKLVTKIFLFDCSSIKALKAKYIAAKGNGRRVSRVDVITGFILGRYITSTEPRDDINYRQCMVIQNMDVRGKIQPRIPKLRSFGNLVNAATVEAQLDGKDEYCFGIVERLKDSAAKIAEDFNKLQHMAKRMMEMRGKKEVVSFNFSSLNKFPAYETDFGWGKPLWVGTTPIMGKNIVLLFGTRDGEGIEAWISLNEEDMATFEADKQIFPHASSSYVRLLDAYSRL